ncbi:MAG: hypothetical protein A3F83_10580 [Candidatus Glassbacteria bacterium RIFCSPLOWO2_12_FULL_58_11]|uniref:Sulfite reductase n=1 Tax=Candidatus Glassbacteria bacterium RIFCSPLOWO2_12_FULL_58_11 TaxID=1817867 RepID=A0A1F5YQ65_9BACT|nr:MAG: hypothetical protein A3F83_10580 [Candidatus Glassbacteria bacterium RIFCSPLOWO2_12_FULL_58_11]
MESLGRMIEQFARGDITAGRFRAYRVPQGIYEQRESGKYMLRVRLPAGIILAHQMRAVAEVSSKYGNGTLHVTTRQDIQVHRVSLEGIYPALYYLFQAGLSTKGGGGNTVRNITSCFDAGVCAREAFDVSPHVLALTEALLADPLSYELPRKYKISFSGCSQDCASATVSDVGFIAKTRDGRPGFSVWAGGGMGANSRVGNLLEEFIPIFEVWQVAEGVKRVFDKHGNRKNKNKARLRFLVDKIGHKQFRKLYEEEIKNLREEPSGFTAPPAPTIDSPQPADSLNFQSERNGNGMLIPQKQPGYFMVQIPLILGDIEAPVFQALAEIIEHYGERCLHTTQQQNLVVRWIAESDLPALKQQLGRLNLGGAKPAILRDMVACAGASTCRLGICLSRGLAQALIEAFSGSGLDLAGLGNLKINISGCPNACGRHPVSQIGLFGVARRVEQRLVPYYTLQLGGKLEEGSTRLAGSVCTIASKNVPVFLSTFLQEFQRSDQHPDFEAFLDNGGKKLAEELAKNYSTVPAFYKDKNFYFDWGAEVAFSLAGRGPGECGAGVFDLIEMDLVGAAEALKDNRLFTAVSLAARALLVTRGEQPSDDMQSLALFKKYFLQEGLLEQKYEEVIDAAIGSLAASDRETSIPLTVEEVTSLVKRVDDLHQNMDDSLRFPQVGGKEINDIRESAQLNSADLSKDFRGVVCPLNFVKVKLALDQLKSGQTLLVLLDEQGADNVPSSVEKEGHKVLSLTRGNGYWQLIIRKA